MSSNETTTATSRRAAAKSSGGPTEGDGADKGAPAEAPKGGDATAAGKAQTRARARGPLRLLRRIVEPVWKLEEERHVRATRVVLSERQEADLERAFAVQRVAAAAIAAAAGDRTRADANLPAVLSLLRDGVLWSLNALCEDPAPINAAETLARPPVASALGTLVPDEAARERVQALLSAPADARWRRAHDEEARAYDEMSALSTALLRRLTESRRRLRHIFLRRLAVSLVGAAVVFTAVQIFLTVRLTPSLTAGKPWRASSALDICRPKEHYCADAVTDIFFCTTDELNPWVEYDLGDRPAFRHLVVKNRSDCCPDRAVPLALEVSDDRNEWHEVARRNETFSLWRADFPATHARYARLRALRRTILHLDSFDLYR